SQSPSMLWPSDVFSTPLPLRLPVAYRPSNSTSSLPSTIQRNRPMPDARPSVHPPDHVTDSFGIGFGFQTLHGWFVTVIQSGLFCATPGVATSRKAATAIARLMFIKSSSLLTWQDSTILKQLPPKWKHPPVSGAKTGLYTPGAWRGMTRFSPGCRQHSPIDRPRHCGSAAAVSSRRINLVGPTYPAASE